MRRERNAEAICIALILLVILAFRPPIIGGSALSEEQKTAVSSEVKGLYSARFSMVPLSVSVEDHAADTVYYTVHDFPLGTVGMSCHAQDGYSMEKPLSGLL